MQERNPPYTLEKSFTTTLALTNALQGSKQNHQARLKPYYEMWLSKMIDPQLYNEFNIDTYPLGFTSKFLT